MMRKRTFFPIGLFLILFLFFLGQTVQVAAQTETEENQDVEVSVTPTVIVELTATPQPGQETNNSQTPDREKAEIEWPAVIPLIHSDPIPIGYGPVDFPEGMNPITGLMVENPELLERRPLVIKVTNWPRKVRPQYGISYADIVYEYYMERGISRFVTVFYGENADKVGPIRSGRFFDEHIFRMYEGYFVFGYATPVVMDYLYEQSDFWADSMVLDFDSEDHPCDIDSPRFLCRDLEIETYNNLFTNTEKLQEQAEKKVDNYRPDLSGLRFESRVPLAGVEVTKIFTRYSLLVYNKWEYDLDSGRYYRFSENYGYEDPRFESYDPHLDSLTGEQIAVDNIISLIVPHYFFAKTVEDEILTIPLIGEGWAYVFRDGKAYPCRWVRPKEGVLQYFDLNGEVFALKPGKTWVQVISPTTTLANDTEEWKFYFSPPEVPYDLEENPINPGYENPPYGWYEDEIRDQIYN